MQEKNETKNSSVLLFLRPIENNEERVRIFGENFVKNNRDKCKIEYKDKIYELKEYFEDIDKNYNHKDEIGFFLIGINNIKDISYLFSDCDNLSSILIFSIKDYLIYTDSINNEFSENNSEKSLTNKANSNSLFSASFIFFFSMDISSMFSRKALISLIKSFIILLNLASISFFIVLYLML